MSKRFIKIKVSNGDFEIDKYKLKSEYLINVVEKDGYIDLSDFDKKIVDLYIAYLNNIYIYTENLTREIMEELYRLADFIGDKEFEDQLYFDSNIEPTMKVLGIDNPFENMNPSTFLKDENILRKIKARINKYYVNFMDELYKEESKKIIGDLLLLNLRKKLREMNMKANPSNINQILMGESGESELYKEVENEIKKIKSINFIEVNTEGYLNKKFKEIMDKAENNIKIDKLKRFLLEYKKGNIPGSKPMPEILYKKIYEYLDKGNLTEDELYFATEDPRRGLSLILSKIR